MWVPIADLLPEYTLILPGVLESCTMYELVPLQVKESEKAEPQAGDCTQSCVKSKEIASDHKL